jgi:hypothetical protein
LEAGRQYTFGKTALPNQENIPLAKHVFVYIMDGLVSKPNIHTGVRNRSTMFDTGRKGSKSNM